MNTSFRGPRGRFAIGRWSSTSCVVLALFLFTAVCEATARIPTFSWDTVPRYIHVRKVTAFTPEEVEYLANFPLITFEKTTGNKEFGSTERGTEMAAAAVKHLNPDAKILYYRNILVYYACYAADKQLEIMENPFLSDSSGNTKLVQNRVQSYDLSNEQVQAWWIKNALEVCSSDSIDGSYIEGFEHAVKGMSREDYVAKGIAAVQAAARSGKIIAFIIGAGNYADTDMDDEKPRPNKEGGSSFQDRLTYSLALFLVCAEKYSHFMFSDGYGVDNGSSKLWMNSLPEYSGPLGPPQGPALKAGYTDKRSFQHADVTVDIENETTNITWKSEK